MRFRPVLLSLPLLALVFPLAVARAAPGDTSWTGTISSAWSQPTNWSTSNVPNSTSNALLVGPTPNPDVELGNPINIKSLLIDASHSLSYKGFSGNFVVSTITLDGGRLYLEPTLSTGGSLILKATTSLKNSGKLQLKPTAADVEVQGDIQTLDASTVEIMPGAKTVRVMSTLGNQGTLRIESGAKLEFFSNAKLVQSANSKIDNQGTLSSAGSIIDLSGSTLDNTGSFSVAGGTLTLTDGVVLNNGSFKVSANGVLSISGAPLITGNPLSLDTGSLSLDAPTVPVKLDLRGSIGFIGQVGPQHVLTLYGAAIAPTSLMLPPSLDNKGQIILTGSGKPTLTGNQLQNLPGSVIRADPLGKGAFIDVGNLKNEGILEFAQPVFLSAINGVTTNQGKNSVIRLVGSTSLDATQSHTINNVCGTIEGTGMLTLSAAAQLTNSGVIAPGTSSQTGNLFISGKVNLHDQVSEIALKLGDVDKMEVDTVHFTDTTELKGALRIKLQGSFSAANFGSKSIAIITCDATLSGGFSNLDPNGRVLVNGGSFKVTYEPKAVTLSDFQEDFFGVERGGCMSPPSACQELVGSCGTNTKTGALECLYADIPNQFDTDNDGSPDCADDDDDGDDIKDDVDNCQFDSNSTQADLDKDGIGDACEDDTDGDGFPDLTDEGGNKDNCPLIANPGQEDKDTDGLGDACDSQDDSDSDQDNIPAFKDNCPSDKNPGQEDTDSDKKGDACDDDDDNDTVLDAVDNCPLVANPDQLNTDGQGSGDACVDDADGDGVKDDVDNCPLAVNPEQINTDSDQLGDVCDPDDDNDDLVDESDNCPLVVSKDQTDTDGDKKGDVCDDDDDNDGKLDEVDNCPLNINPDQEDADNNGVGDACDNSAAGNGGAAGVAGQAGMAGLGGAGGAGQGGAGSGGSGPAKLPDLWSATPSEGGAAGLAGAGTAGAGTAGAGAGAAGGTGAAPPAEASFLREQEGGCAAAAGRPGAGAGAFAVAALGALGALVRRRRRTAAAAALGVAGLGAAALLPGCADKNASTVVVALSSEASIPEEVDIVDIEVVRGSDRSFFQRYPLKEGTKLPGTLTLKPHEDEDTDGSVTVTVTAWAGAKQVVLRRATTSFVEEKQKLLRMPIRYSCYDFPGACSDGQTCKGGTCVSQQVSPISLPDFAPTQVFGKLGESGCFDDSDSGCLIDRKDVDAFESLPEGKCAFPAPTATGSLNLAVFWQRARDQAHPTVLDYDDPDEGWAFSDDKSKVVLAPGLCAAIQSKQIRKVQYSLGKPENCAPKPVTTPLCERAPAVRKPLSEDACTQCVYLNVPVCKARDEFKSIDIAAISPLKEALACTYDGELNSLDECDAIDACFASRLAAFSTCDPNARDCSAYEALQGWFACVDESGGDWRGRCAPECAATIMQCAR